jgi:hypothetical protein
MRSFVPHPTEEWNSHPCWQWIGATEQHGYGMITVHRREHPEFEEHRAHRLAHEMFKGPIPVGLQIDHLCRHPWCVNPSHLESVTKDENNRRGNSLSARRGRQTHCLNGHELAGDNLMIEQGHRRCRICRLAQRRAWFKKSRQRSTS